MNIFKSIYQKLFRMQDYNRSEYAKEIFGLIKDKTEAKGANFMLFFLPTFEEKSNNRHLVDLSYINYIDLMRDFPNKNLHNLFLENSRHYNKEGHEFVADLIMKHLNDPLNVTVDKLIER